MANSNAFDGARVLWYVTPASVAESSIDAMIANIRTLAPNVTGVMVKGWNGGGFAYGALASKKGMAVANENDMRVWVDKLHAAGLKCYAWGVARGVYPKSEIDVMRRIAFAGVDALVVDVESGPSYYVGTAQTAVALAVAAQATGVHVGLCLDYRGNHPRDSKADLWYPYVDSLHPMCYHYHFQRPAAAVITEMLGKLAPMGKPIVPALQGYSVGSRLYNPDDIAPTARVAQGAGVVGLSWFRYGKGLEFHESGLGARDLWAIAQVGGSNPPAPALFSYTDKAGATVDVLSINGGKWRTRKGDIAPVALRAA